MKNAKKVLAMVIVLALAISMAIPASAAKIEINNAQKGSVYTIWKMADLTLSTDGKNYSYTVNNASPWYDFFVANSATFKLTEAADGNYVIESLLAEDAELPATVAKAAVTWAIEKNITGTQITADDSGTVSFDSLALGYYCVNTEMGSFVAVDTADVNDTFVIDEKNTTPTIAKLVKEADTSDAFAATNYANIGDTLVYQVTVKVGKGAEGYIVDDTMEAGLTYVGDIECTSGNATITKIDDGDDNDQTVRFKIEGEELLTTGTDIVFTYKATVNAEAEIFGDSNDNTAVIKYGIDDENNTDGKFTGLNAVTKTYVMELTINKVDEDSDPLKDAVFNLLDGGTKLYFVFDAATNTYRLTESTTAGAVTDLEDNDGNYHIEGLDAGEYILVETEAPNGYNKLKDPITVTIGEDGKVSYSEEVNKDTVVVVNKSGTELPSTGGVGTVIFVAVGSFLVMAMGVLLVVRKRMSKVVYTR